MHDDLFGKVRFGKPPMTADEHLNVQHLVRSWRQVTTQKPNHLPRRVSGDARNPLCMSKFDFDSLLTAY